MAVNIHKNLSFISVTLKNGAKVHIIGHMTKFSLVIFLRSFILISQCRGEFHFNHKLHLLVFWSRVPSLCHNRGYE